MMKRSHASSHPFPEKPVAAHTTKLKDAGVIKINVLVIPYTKVVKEGKGRQISHRRKSIAAKN